MAGSLKLRAQSLFGVLIKRSYGFKSSFAIALLLAMAATYGFFTPIDGFLYDAFVRTMPAASQLKRQVALIDVPVEKFSSNDTDWEAMVSRAMDLGAKQVVFTIAPTFDTTRLGYLLQRKDVIIGGAITPDPDNELDNRFISAPRIGTLTFPAVAAVPDPLLGVHRYQRFSYQVNQQAIPSLEVLAAQRLGVATSSDGRFMVNFSGQQNHFPRMSLAQVLEGGLIRDVIQGRVVVIGPALDRLHRSVVTPITQGNRQVSELEYHAFALDSLLNNTAVASLWPAAKGLLILAMWLVCFLIIQPMSFRRGMLAITAISLAFLLIAWVALAAAQVHIPVVGAILILGTTLVSVFQSKGQQQNEQLSRLVNETSLLVSTRGSGPVTSSASGFWGNVLAMLDQMVPLSRAVLLANANQSKHVVLVQTLRCSTDIIHERRRDYNRTPYSTALAARAPIEVNQYLSAGDDNETQLLVPLHLDGEVLGFLALGMPIDSAIDRPALMRTLAILGEHLTDLMLERRQVEQREWAAKGWQESLRDPRDDAIHALSQNTRVIGRHTTVLQDMVNSLDAATAVYDLFGRTVLVNRRMTTELANAELGDTELTAADLLTIACAMSLDEARGVIVRIVLDDHSFERTARLGDGAFLLLASALRDTSTSIQPESASLESLHGVMFQLFPVSNVVKRETLRQGIALEITDESCTSSKILDKPLSVQAHRQSNVLPIKAASLTEPYDQDIDVWQMTEILVGSLRTQPEYAHVAIHIEGERRPGAVLAPYAELKGLLGALLQLLIEDSREPGAVFITIQPEPEVVIIEMRNDGYGIPNDKLQSMLSGPAFPHSSSLRTIRQLRQLVLAQGSQLSIDSEIGKGYAARLRLQRRA